MAARRTVLVSVVTGLVGVAAVLAAARWDWLGPDVGRGAEFCEAFRPGWIKQPANSWSNLGFVVAGVVAGGHVASRGARSRLGLIMGAHPGLALTYAVLTVILGPASMAMHATGTAWGGRIDQVSMFLLAGFAGAYAVLRLVRRGPLPFAVGFPALVVWAEGVRAGWWGGPDWAAFGNRGNSAFAVLLGIALVGEVVLALRRSARQDVGWGVAALLAFAGSFGVWNLGKVGSPWCDPHSLFQWHAVWHVGCAVAAYLLFRHYTGERAR